MVPFTCKTSRLRAELRLGSTQAARQRSEAHPIAVHDKHGHVERRKTEGQGARQMVPCTGAAHSLTCQGTLQHSGTRAHLTAACAAG